MNRDDVIKMAREAGFTVGYGSPALEKHERFAQLVAAQAAAEEREACAKVCESRVMGDHSREDQEAQRCARDIRERGTA